ncbi:thioredoxin family protein [Agromyces kandeliae]|uniref:Thioredoxin family protein n=1 Tax=Agromyces kandeliae TaxID=2666141 RepID=A0A6L5QZK2_9MICO|nr:thioredoxin family protein [Agromyces kandeliae]MRX43191.1 thioredoxin family protein [Agromyces kandeliae]
MRIEVLHIEDCPNWRGAGRLVQDALELLGRSEPVSARLIESPEQAAGTAFAGSPTISVDGDDLFPTEVAVTELACRVFATPDGPAGLPTLQQVVERLRERGGSRA